MYKPAKKENWRGKFSPWTGEISPDTDMVLFGVFTKRTIFPQIMAGKLSLQFLDPIYLEPMVLFVFVVKY